MIAEGLIPKKMNKNKKKVGGVQTSFLLQLKHIWGRPYLVVVIMIKGITFAMIAGAGALLTPLLSSFGYEEVKNYFFYCFDFYWFF